MRFANVINSTKTVSTMNSDNSNIANFKTQHHEIIATITKRLLK